MPKTINVTQFAVKVTRDTRDLPIITIDHRVLHFWLFKEGEAILYISTDKPISRYVVATKTGKLHSQIAAAGLTV